MNSILIEPATNCDVEAMSQCARKAYRHYIERLGKEPGPMLDDYGTRVSENDAYVVRRKGQIIALLVLVMSDTGCLLDNIAVDPSFTGLGIGKKLMKFAEDQAIRKGYAELELYTHELMTENIAMYLKWGYLVDRHIYEKGYDRVYMKKALSVD